MVARSNGDQGSWQASRKKCRLLKSTFHLYLQGWAPVGGSHCSTQIVLRGRGGGPRWLFNNANPGRIPAASETKTSVQSSARGGTAAGGE